MNTRRLKWDLCLEYFDVSYSFRILHELPWTQLLAWTMNIELARPNYKQSFLLRTLRSIGLV